VICKYFLRNFVKFWIKKIGGDGEGFGGGFFWGGLIGWFRQGFSVVSSLGYGGFEFWLRWFRQAQPPKTSSATEAQPPKGAQPPGRAKSPK